MYVMQSPPGAETVIDGKRYTYFAGTGYFCLHGHPEVVDACCEAARKYGIGSATSRNGFGDNPALLEVERRAAEFFAAEEAFYFVSGYSSSAIMAQGLGDEFDLFFVDELAHYSVFDGVRQSGKRLVTFRHLDATDLAGKLKSELASGQRPLVICDGIFPVSGAISPVVEYLEVLASYRGSGICLDDAHAVGVLGEHGRGTFEHFGLQGERLYFSGTLSKAFGGHGGIIPGSEKLVERLRSASKIYAGSSPPPAPAAAATAKALEIVSAHPELRTKLRENISKLKAGLRDLGFETDDTPVPIICLALSSAERMERIQAELMERGIVVAYIKSYAGVGKEGAIRIAVFSSHTDAMIDRLLNELRLL